MKDCVFNTSKPFKHGKILGSHKESKKSILIKPGKFFIMISFSFLLGKSQNGNILFNAAYLSKKFLTVNRAFV